MNFLVHEEWIGDTPILSENIEVHHFSFTQLLAAQCPKSRTISLFGRRDAATSLNDPNQTWLWCFDEQFLRFESSLKLKSTGERRRSLPAHNPAFNLRRTRRLRSSFIARYLRDHRPAIAPSFHTAYTLNIVSPHATQSRASSPSPFCIAGRPCRHR